jgi:hypothetical protein
MGYCSKFSSQTPVITEANFQQFVDEAETDPAKGRGHRPRSYDKVPFGSLADADPFTIPLIPRNEWTDRIREMESYKSRLSDSNRARGVKVKNQDRTNFCWINAPTSALETVRAAQGQPYIELSAASAGALIKHYRNEGGWGTEALKFLADVGCVPAADWPANHWQDDRYDTPETKALRARYRVLKWWELQPRNLDEMMTCLFLRIPVCAGLNWWGHEVLYLDPVVQDGVYGVRFQNSWGADWGDNGCGIILGNKALPDDAVAPRSVIGTREARSKSYLMAG